MDRYDAAVAVFADHLAAEDAVNKLAAAGFPMQDLSIVGRGYHTNEKVTGFFPWATASSSEHARRLLGRTVGPLLRRTVHDRTIVGHVVVLGYVATAAVSALKISAVVGGLSALDGAGIPKGSVLTYGAALAVES